MSFEPVDKSPNNNCSSVTCISVWNLHLHKHGTRFSVMTSLLTGPGPVVFQAALSSEQQTDTSAAEWSIHNLLLQTALKCIDCDKMQRSSIQGYNCSLTQRSRCTAPRLARYILTLACSVILNWWLTAHHPLLQLPWEQILTCTVQILLFFSPLKKQDPYLHLLLHLSGEQASSAHLPVVDPPDHHPCFPPFLPSWERNAGKDKTTSKDTQM